MQHYDPLDWIHQWDDFEMMMYARHEPENEAGIYMQVSRKFMRDGAEEWKMLYERKIADLDGHVSEEPGSDMWEERVLRDHLGQNPQLVNEEKAYLASFLQTLSEGE